MTTPRISTLPELDRKLDASVEDGVHQITLHDYERFFGTNEVALARPRNFARSHKCVASFSDRAILFRRQSQKP